MRFFCHEHILGVGVDFKRLQPREFITTSAPTTPPSQVKTSDTIDAVSALVYAEIFANEFDTKLKFIYGSNLNDMGMIGGYGVSDANFATGARCYTPLRNLSCIADICWKRKVEPGIFVGYTKNIGSTKNLFNMSNAPANVLIDEIPLLAGKYEVYGINDNLNSLDHVFGVSPRLKWHMQPVTFATELRYLRAAYAADVTDSLGKVIPLVDCRGRACGPDQHVDMLRFIASAYYWF